MTITIDISDATVRRLNDEAERAGVTVSDLLEQIVVERYEAPGRLQKLFDKWARPGHIDDLSRDAIYAD